MKLIFIFTAVIISVMACRNSKIIIGKAGAVRITAEPSVFTDSFHPVPSVSYTTLDGLKGEVLESIELRNGEISRAKIKGWTLFQFEYDFFLAYPGDNIIIKGTAGDPDFAIVNETVRRHRELRLFHDFRKLQINPKFPLYAVDPSLDTILKLETEFKNIITKVEIRSRWQFDSLAKDYNVSTNFPKVSHSFLDNRFDLELIRFYSLYKDTLKSHSLYNQKLRQLIPAFNQIRDRDEFSHVLKGNLNELVRDLFPDIWVWNNRDQVEFNRCFDTMANNFKGPVRNYLLSRAMYKARSLGIPVSKEYQKKYKRLNTDRAYRNIVRKAKRNWKRGEKDHRVLPNQLITSKNNNEIRLEDLVKKHAGRLIFFDFWASWCGPCVDEIPFIQALAGKYSDSQIVFISVSIDKSTLSWRRALAKYALTEEQSFLLLNANKSAFHKKYQLDAIPRFMIFGKDGVLVDDNAPAPSNPALPLLLDRLLNQH